MAGPLGHDGGKRSGPPGMERELSAHGFQSERPWKPEERWQLAAQRVCVHLCVHVHLCARACIVFV